MNHSSLFQFASKLLAYVVSDLFPNSQIVESGTGFYGFYCDFILSPPLTEQFLGMIEERFGQVCLHVPQAQLIHMMRENAVDFLEHQQQSALAEQVAHAEENIVDLIKIDNFYDRYCGDFIPDLAKIGAFKLLSLSRQEVFYPALGKLFVHRIQGVVFEERKDLKKFIKLFKHHQRHNHLLLGPEMELFQFTEQAYIFLPLGEELCELLKRWCRQGYESKGYQKISLGGLNLAPKSGSNLWTIDWEGESYVLPSDPSPFAIRSYRFFEEKFYLNPTSSNSLEGLLNSQSYRASTALLSCKTDQLLDEVISCLQFINRTVKVFGFEHQWILYPKAEKNRAASKDRWVKAIEILQKAGELCGLDYQIDETPSSRLGPSMEAKLIDSLGRQWNGPQVEFDFLSSGQSKSEPLWAIKWTALGSIERALALLVEKYDGCLPFWLAPEQVRILPIGEDVAEYAKEIQGLMVHQNLKVAVDKSSEKLGDKIFKATRQRIPYLVILGDKEKRENRMTIRSFGNSTDKVCVKIESFLSQLQKENQLPEENEH